VFIAVDVHNIPQVFPILSQINPVHILPPNSWRLIIIILLHLYPGFPSYLFPSVLLAKLYVRFLHLVCVLHTLSISSTSLST